LLPFLNDLKKSRWFLKIATCKTAEVCGKAGKIPYDQEQPRGALKTSLEVSSPMRSGWRNGSPTKLRRKFQPTETHQNAKQNSDRQNARIKHDKSLNRVSGAVADSHCPATQFGF